ncbi:putative IMV protein VP55-like protein [Seal parapoxvirus]|uniref:Putative IMV protein VP55-like protein n=1 Tax=Seal parapoxvirus TaxID=187984 RepID=A0A1Z3GCT9_9POXV|nr:putative IMV protein VP55-like protein [Seal parapoxvirus]ASC55581.1 putative IMV protein VP55-like protein [Seal parapoxvirus]
MDSSPEVINAYVVTVVDHRSTTDVFPTLSYLSKKGLRDDPAPKPPAPPAPQPAPAPGPAPTPSPSPPPQPPHPKGDHVISAQEWSGSGKDYQQYFTDVCRSACPREMRDRVAKHLSLWELLSTNGKQKDEDFIVVVNNDMTFKHPEMVRPLIAEMANNNWYFVQLRETYATSVSATPVPGTGDPQLVVYAGGFDVSLDAYIIQVGSMKRLFSAIVKDGGVRSSMLTEISVLEKTLGLSRMVLSGAETVVYPEYYIQVKKRLSDAPSMWALLGTWLAKFWPSAMYFLTTPLLSFMGMFDINVVDVFILAYLLVLFILLPHSRLLWFFAGILLTAIV